MSRNIDATTHDFLPDPDSGETVAKDQIYYTMGGMISAKTVKMTKSNQNMAFITLEDLLGTIEVVVFPKMYEQYRQYLEQDEKIFVYGRASISEDEGKLLLEKVVPFSEVPRQLYLQCENKEDFKNKQDAIYGIVDTYAGRSEVIVVLKEEKLMKPLGTQFRVDISEASLGELKKLLGEGKVVTKEGKLSMKGYSR